MADRQQAGEMERERESCGRNGGTGRILYRLRHARIRTCWHARKDSSAGCQILKEKVLILLKKNRGIADSVVDSERERGGERVPST